MKPHGRDCPDRCSLCQGAQPHHVTVESGEVVIDGEPTGRAVDPGLSPRRTVHQTIEREAIAP